MRRRWTALRRQVVRLWHLDSCALAGCPKHVQKTDLNMPSFDSWHVEWFDIPMLISPATFEKLYPDWKWSRFAGIKREIWVIGLLQVTAECQHLTSITIRNNVKQTCWWHCYFILSCFPGAFHRRVVQPTTYYCTCTLAHGHTASRKLSLRGIRTLCRHVRSQRCICRPVFSAACACILLIRQYVC